jgi:hypothetical protein
MSNKIPLANRLAFPATGAFHADYGGMTYRQWLIGIIASGASAPTVGNWAEGIDTVATRSILLADTIIDKLRD